MPAIELHLFFCHGLTWVWLHSPWEPWSGRWKWRFSHHGANFKASLSALEVTSGFTKAGLRSSRPNKFLKQAYRCFWRYLPTSQKNLWMKVPQYLLTPSFQPCLYIIIYIILYIYIWNIWGSNGGMHIIDFGQLLSFDFVVFNLKTSKSSVKLSFFWGQPILNRCFYPWEVNTWSGETHRDIDRFESLGFCWPLFNEVFHCVDLPEKTGTVAL